MSEQAAELMQELTAVFTEWLEVNRRAIGEDVYNRVVERLAMFSSAGSGALATFVLYAVYIAGTLCMSSIANRDYSVDPESTDKLLRVVRKCLRHLLGE